MMRYRKGVCVLPILSILTLAVVAHGAPQNHRSADDNNPDLAEIRHYRLTTDNVQKFEAANDAILKMVAADPGLKKRMDSGSAADDKSLDQKAKEFDTNFPQLTAVIKRNDLSTREYIVMSLALFNDVMVVGMKKQGAFKDYPPNTITPENAAFVEQHYDKLAEMLQKMTSQTNDDQK